MTGSELIKKERERQVTEEHWTPEDDATLVNGELVDGAVSYLRVAELRECFNNYDVPLSWPWADEWWKPTPDNRMKELVKAGALIAAELDRMIAMKNESTT